MYVIVGAAGFLGSYMIKAVLENTTDSILAADLNVDSQTDTDRIKWIKVDVTNLEDIKELNKKIADLSPVKTIYLAAYHHPDKVKANPKLAWHINITALSQFVNILENCKCLFYSSTEMVYGEGEEGSVFKEDSKLLPVNLYGIHKVVAESIVTGYGYNVVRFPFLIGPSILDNYPHFYDVICDTLSQGKNIEMFEDSYKSALDFDTASKVVIELIENYREDMPKILNVSGDEVLSKYEIGKRIANKYGYSEELIVPISLQHDTVIFKEKRAGYTLLDNSLVKEILNKSELKLSI